MEKQKNGFVIVETIVVVVFVLGLITFLFYNVLPLVGEYERISRYDSISSKYDAHMIKKMLLKDGCKLQNILSFGSRSYSHFPGTELCLYIDNKNYCEKLLSEDFLDVKEIIITNYVVNDTFKENANAALGREATDYINQLPAFNNPSISAYHYQKRLIVIFNDGSASNIEILKADTTSACGAFTGCV